MLFNLVHKIKSAPSLTRASGLRSCVGTLLFFGLILLSICGFFFWLLLKKPFPSDKQMIDTYYQHKTEFNQLAQLLISNRELYVIDPSAEKCELKNLTMVNATENEECNKVVQLSKLLESNIQFIDSGDDGFIIYISPSGSTWTLSKGYDYQVSPIEPSSLLVNDTDLADHSDHQSAYHYIEGNWYIAEYS